jgi:putative hydrolase of the HAD superfamily
MSTSGLAFHALKLIILNHNPIHPELIRGSLGISRLMVELLLFDLGGVVIDIDFERIFKKWSFYSGLPVQEIKAAFSADAALEQYERGQIDSTEYCRYVCDSIDMEMSFDQFSDGWNNVMVAPISPTVNLLRDLSTQIPLYALSNANPLHKAYWENTYADELGYFNQIFVSSDIGHRKPEPDAYLQVADELDVNLQNIVFFDDLADNVEGARSLGMQAVQVKSPADIARFIASTDLQSRRVKC